MVRQGNISIEDCENGIDVRFHKVILDSIEQTFNLFRESLYVQNCIQWTWCTGNWSSEMRRKIAHLVRIATCEVPHPD
jgi:hypothetical protein